MSKVPIYSEDFYNHAPHDLESLEKNVREYPFSSIANFLLLYHYKKTSHADFEKFARKTALHFNNTHWLQLQLNEKSTENEAAENYVQDVEEPRQEIVESAGDSSNEIISPENYPEEIKEFIEDNSVTTTQEIEHSGEPYEIISEEPGSNLMEHSHQKEEQIMEVETTTEVADSIPAFEPASTQIPLEEEDTIAFEPLHTVDYFASQGIKINDELITNDKLGSQMKSFTAWLKSMKKLHPGRLAEQNVATEKLIQTAAEESNVNTEVLTEAMAEVLIKQDKREKAIEMFSKLSLINPSKSAYFAAKIESIKSS
ncbi:MAG: hypothetical protein M3139_08450 [Bacteroidota bacterium]|nr:hypothetical protein [Bacteroidota bacterium]